MEFTGARYPAARRRRGMAARGRSLDGSWQGVSDPVSSQEHPGPRRLMAGPGRHARRDRERGPPLAHHEPLSQLRLAGSRKHVANGRSPPGRSGRPCRVRPARRRRWPPRTAGWTAPARCPASKIHCQGRPGSPRNGTSITGRSSQRWAETIAAARCGCGRVEHRPQRVGPRRKQGRSGACHSTAAITARAVTGIASHRQVDPPSSRGRGAPANRRAPFHRAPRGTHAPAWRRAPAAARQAPQSTRHGACEACARAPRRTGPRRPRLSAGSARPAQAAPTAARRAAGSAQGVVSQSARSPTGSGADRTARRRAPSRSRQSERRATETDRRADARATAGRALKTGRSVPASPRRPSTGRLGARRSDSAPVRRRNARASS